MADSASCNERRSGRTERLLKCFQKAHNHELPNHLVAIQGLVRLLKLEMEPKLDEESLEIFKRLETASQRTHEVIRTLAAIGRIGEEKASEEPVNLLDAAQEAACAVTSLLPRTAVQYDFPVDLPMLALDSASVHLVMYHLLRRAAQSAVGSKAVQVRVGARLDEEGVAFWVADDGPVLSNRELEEVLEPFTGDHRQEATRGLGMFLVRQWVDAWGATLRVEADTDKGNVFTLVCPSELVLSPFAPTVGPAQ
jgi:K+-sensing histidine kinase KdpD